MDDYLKRWVEGKDTDRDRKELGSVAKQLLEDDKFQLIQAILAKYVRAEESPLSLTQEKASALFWFGKGLNSIPLELDKMVEVSYTVIENEKFEDPDVEIKGDIYVSYGEGVDVSNTGNLV